MQNVTICGLVPLAIGGLRYHNVLYVCLLGEKNHPILTVDSFDSLFLRHPISLFYNIYTYILISYIAYMDCVDTLFLIVTTVNCQ